MLSKSNLQCFFFSLCLGAQQIDFLDYPFTLEGWGFWVSFEIYVVAPPPEAFIEKPDIITDMILHVTTWMPKHKCQILMLRYVQIKKTLRIFQKRFSPNFHGCKFFVIWGAKRCLFFYMHANCFKITPLRQKRVRGWPSWKIHIMLCWWVHL